MSIASDSIMRPARRVGTTLGTYLRSSVDRGLQSQRRRRALRQALRAFEASHPHWAASGFDATLLGRADADEAWRAQDADALARAWTQQFGYADERHRARDVAAVRDVAQAFLDLLAEAEGSRAGGRSAADRLSDRTGHQR